eukprot:COSAG02_NODE_415_length_22762_cov_133.681816_9_plen_128_part_00
MTIRADFTALARQPEDHSHAFAMASGKAVDVLMIHACTMTPSCGAHGTCQVDGDGHTCSCADGWSGNSCSISSPTGYTISGCSETKSPTYMPATGKYTKVSGKEQGAQWRIRLRAHRARCVGAVLSS